MLENDRMSEDDNELYDRELLDEMERIAERSDARVPYLDNIQGYKELGEVSKVEDWAKEMEKRGHVISGVKSNVDDNGRPDDPPDVLAEVDGELVGIEVTDLLVYVKERIVDVFDADGHVARLTWRMRGGQVSSFRWDGPGYDEEERAALERRIRENPRFYGDAWVAWPLEQFREYLGRIVDKKDKKASVKRESRLREQGRSALDLRLSESFLLIFTPELYLQGHLEQYVEKTELPRPRNFDRVFVMGEYRPDGGSGGHPLFEVPLSGPVGRDAG